jgi:hypothetical protein
MGLEPIVKSFLKRIIFHKERIHGEQRATDHEE